MEQDNEFLLQSNRITEIVGLNPTERASLIANARQNALARRNFNIQQEESDVAAFLLSDHTYQEHVKKLRKYVGISEEEKQVLTDKHRNNALERRSKIVNDNLSNPTNEFYQKLFPTSTELTTKVDSNLQAYSDFSNANSNHRLRHNNNQPIIKQSSTPIITDTIPQQHHKSNGGHHRAIKKLNQFQLREFVHLVHQLHASVYTQVVECMVLAGNLIESEATYKTINKRYRTDSEDDNNNEDDDESQTLSQQETDYLQYENDADKYQDRINENSSKSKKKKIKESGTKTTMDLRKQRKDDKDNKKDNNDNKDNDTVENNK